MTKQEYQDYQRAVERNLNGLTHVSTGACPGCDECGLPAESDTHQLEQAGEPSVSWRECECCGSALGGDRHPAHGIIAVTGDKQQLLHFSVCSDCLMFINYGKLDDETMSAMSST